MGRVAAIMNFNSCLYTTTIYCCLAIFCRREGRALHLNTTAPRQHGPARHRKPPAAQKALEVSLQFFLGPVLKLHDTVQDGLADAQVDVAYSADSLATAGEFSRLRLGIRLIRRFGCLCLSTS